jgi:F-type H+-transporting ATPase subunit delta
VSDSAIAIRYAKALLNIAVEADQVEQFAGEISQVAQLLQEQDLLRLLLDSPTFALEKKTAIMLDIAEQMQLSEGMKLYLSLLLQKGRIIYLPQIDRSYRKFADNLSGVVRAQVTSARKLTKERTTKIQQMLEEQTGKKIVLSVDTDAELIGGMQVEMGGKLFDGSIKTQLKRVSNTLAKG